MRSRHEEAQRSYWRYGRRQARGDLCRTALAEDLFERANPELVLEEIRRGPGGHLPHRREAAS